ncbi:HFR038Wp [Eremothecium sinecaudum]|uniref:Polynucleotide 5'-hydroxyl-kinase GRC3 n=1 Tax=Eremothecium sinecaudum TaxID=45286 RepID=A0A0X8HUZ7_9SACH|nr:HFR038Wp [Eremothecium sinecaudum]AMD21893.1 HFR038Wp [Eremothecium sinecaudum]
MSKISELPEYEEGSSESESDSSNSCSTTLKATASPYVDEYDSDGYNTSGKEECTNFSSSNLYIPLSKVNYFPLVSDNSSSVIVCLRNQERLMISGTFRVQVLKGGFTYNSVHYNAGVHSFEYWHPISDSITPIVSSFYANWTERLFDIPSILPAETVKEYLCILKITNGPNINAIGALTSELGQLWAKRAASTNTTFTILNEQETSARELTISKEWANILDELSLFHQNCESDMRVLCIGGKNSGKSTLLRLLVQKLVHGRYTDVNNIENEAYGSNLVNYLDLDPGQPEYSSPESISWNKITSSSLSLGQHMAQGMKETVKEIYLGSSSPQSWPETYLKATKAILQSWDSENLMGTTVLNLPGWIKGFGVKIMNSVIKDFKPTHLILLKHKNRQISKELKVPDNFETVQRGTYQPHIIDVPAFHENIVPGRLQQDPRYHASNIRHFKLLAYFHKQSRFSYNPFPLLKAPPLQIAFGSQGIRGFQFLHDYSDRFHQDDLAGALEGCIVSIYCTQEPPLVEYNGIFPMHKTSIFSAEMNFIALGLIHSIDCSQKFMNIYIPEHKIDELKSTRGHFILVRGNTELPVNELYPYSVLGSSKKDDVPYIAFDKRKKFDHVWKVRKNVMRRGHFMK